MITIDFSSRGNLGLCEFICQSLRSQILTGVLKAGIKLPSKRNFASHLGVSIITVQNAYSSLISEGYIYSIEKKGFYVTDISVSPAQHLSKPLSPSLKTVPSNSSTSTEELFFDFTNNSTSAQKFPFNLWAKTMRQVLNSSDEKLLQRTGIKGSPELRQALSEYLKEFRNMNVSPDQIVVGAGAEILYSLIVQFLGRDKIYAVENPGFKKARQIIELNGAECRFVQIDEQGISVPRLEQVNADVIHLSPNHHFPTGIVMPVKRRMELIEWTKKSSDRFLIEDDYDSEFRFNGRPLPTLSSLDPHARIIYINTFSKTLSPSFRISYMVLPEEMAGAFEKRMSSYSCQVSSFEQFTLARFISGGFFEKHINRMKNYYRSIRNSLILELKKSSLASLMTIREQEAGLHFLITVQSLRSPEELKARLLEEGIKISLLREFDYEQKDDTCTFVVNYSALKKEQISGVVARMEAAIKYLDE